MKKYTKNKYMYWINHHSSASYVEQNSWTFPRSERGIPTLKQVAIDYITFLSAAPPLQSSIHVINASSPIMAGQFIFSNVPRKPAASRSSGWPVHRWWCTCAGLCLLVRWWSQLLIFMTSMSARGDEETPDLIALLWNLQRNVRDNVWSSFLIVELLVRRWYNGKFVRHIVCSLRGSAICCLTRPGNW